MPKRRITNVDAARSGDPRQALEALRDTLAARLDAADRESNAYAGVAAQYRATLADLAALPPTEGKTARERLNDRVAAARVANANTAS